MLDADLQTSILKSVDDGFDDLVALTAELVKFPSVRGAEHTAQDFVAGQLRERGLGVDRWRIDIDAIRQAIIDLAARGAAVLVMSQDLDELSEISDRLVVLCAGRLSAPRASRWLRSSTGRDSGARSRAPAPAPAAGRASDQVARPG